MEIGIDRNTHSGTILRNAVCRPVIWIGAMNCMLERTAERRQYHNGAMAALKRRRPGRGRRSINEQTEWLEGYSKMDDFLKIRRNRK